MGLLHPHPDDATGLYFYGKLLLLFCAVGVLVLAFAMCCIDPQSEFAQAKLHSLMVRKSAAKRAARISEKFD